MYSLLYIYEQLNEELQGLQEKFMNSIENTIKLNEFNKTTDVNNYAIIKKFFNTYYNIYIYKIV